MIDTATSSVSATDPRLTTELSTWQPPIPWDELDSDKRTAVEALAGLSRFDIASDLCTCKSYFVPILTYESHWSRLGRATCHKKFVCRNCGRGTARAHRLRSVDEERYDAITADYTRTLRLVVNHSSAAGSPDEYSLRVNADKRHMRSMWRRIRRDVPNAGMIVSVELDPRLQYVAFRVYLYSDSDPRHWYFVEQWRQIVGMMAACESSTRYDGAKDALIWTLSSWEQVLMEPGSRRAIWEIAFEGKRLSASYGSLRGARLDESAPDSDDKKDNPAPYGYCPCGCGGVVERAKDHKPRPLSELQRKYERLSFGSLKDYVAYSPKVNGYRPQGYQIVPTTPLVASSPPPW